MLSFAPVEGAGAPAPVILLVVDNDDARQLLSQLLRREGYSVVEAGDGQQALDALARGPTPDLILLDMLLPVLDGWHFLEEVQGRTAAVTPPILIVTGSGAIGRDWAEAHGCAGVLAKPVDEAQLRTEVRRCLAATRL